MEHNPLQLALGRLVRAAAKSENATWPSAQNSIDLWDDLMLREQQEWSSIAGTEPLIVAAIAKVLREHETKLYGQQPLLPIPTSFESAPRDRRAAARVLAQDNWNYGEIERVLVSPQEYLDSSWRS